jgi:hypothetical protein
MSQCPFRASEVPGQERGRRVRPPMPSTWPSPNGSGGSAVVRQVRIVPDKLPGSPLLVVCRGIDLRPMIFIVGQCGINLRQREAGKDCCRNFFRRITTPIAGSGNVSDANSMAANPRFACQDAGSPDNMSVFRFGCLRIRFHRFQFRCANSMMLCCRRWTLSIISRSLALTNFNKNC